MTSEPIIGLVDTNYWSNDMTKNFVEPPANLPLSPAVKRLRKAYEDAKVKLVGYQRENASYRTRDVSMVGEVKARYSSPALEDAKAELKKLEIAAVKEGKALPNKEVFLGTVKAKSDEYDRTVSALNVLVHQAHRDYMDAVNADLVEMGLKEAKAAQQARDAWGKAHKAAMAARETLEKHGALFTWCATSGQVEGLPLDGASAGNNVDYWEISDDGRLTTEAAIELGFQGLELIEGLVVMPDPVIDEAAETEAEFWKKYRPQIHNAKPEGYGTTWDH
ncbi:hypothetical protein OG292_27600 [Streptomyces sp. NBC_01511]|uniref:hypothetical protein n=1 Tax=Streptomyces sp. NBC_01511 TaxID=2903889 RepID=UPI003866826B